MRRNLDASLDPRKNRRTEKLVKLSPDWLNTSYYFSRQRFPVSETEKRFDVNNQMDDVSNSLRNDIEVSKIKKKMLFN